MILSVLQMVVSLPASIVIYGRTSTFKESFVLTSYWLPLTPAGRVIDEFELVSSAGELHAASSRR